jgi:hypothetical protein
MKEKEVKMVGKPTNEKHGHREKQPERMRLRHHFKKFWSRFLVQRSNRKSVIKTKYNAAVNMNSSFESRLNWLFQAKIVATDSSNIKHNFRRRIENDVLMLPGLGIGRRIENHQSWDENQPRTIRS